MMLWRVLVSGRGFEWVLFRCDGCIGIKCCVKV